MYQSHLERIIVDFCLFYGKTVEVLEFEFDKIPHVRVKGTNENIKGIRNIVSAAYNCKSNCPKDSTLQDQWLEYAVTKSAFLQNPANTSFILKELNEYLADKVYFVGNKRSPVDVLMYLFIYDIMVSFTFQDKEKYLNVSRWFNNMQHDEKLRIGRIPVIFSRTRLYL